MIKDFMRIDGVDINFWNNFVRPTVRRIKGNKCQECDSNKNLDIHHLDYIKEVSINTLDLLCKKCHKKRHKKIK